MAYVKLDTGLLDSTLWVDRESREVFITSLLMAFPYEVVKPLAQIEVRTLEHTGWEVPVGWYGKIEAAGSGIVRRALVDVEAGLAALERLGSPDPESRSHKYEGRRLIRVDGGFIVLNFMDYRDRDLTNKERQQRYRERQKARKAEKQGDAVTSYSNDVTGNDNTVVSSNDKGLVIKDKETATTMGEGWFDELWKLYPKRAGGNPRRDALRAYLARIRGGVHHNDLLEGTQRYAAYIRGVGRWDTEFVMQGARFFGPSQQWEEPWTLPAKPRRETEQDRNTAVLDNWLAKGEESNG